VPIATGVKVLRLRPMGYGETDSPYALRLRRSRHVNTADRRRRQLVFDGV